MNPGELLDLAEKHYLAASAEAENPSWSPTLRADLHVKAGILAAVIAHMRSVNGD